ncbi:PTS sugar transporter subunit IIB [Oscillospiraceae bacterium PP1C4]
MGKVYVRIDDRLIHGQIMTAWCNFLEISEIIGIDDKTASNPLLKQIMTMSVPAKYNCKMLTTDAAKEELKKAFSGNRLVILRFPESLALIKEEINTAEIIVLGNISKKPDSIYNESSGTSMFFLTEKDVQVVDDLAASGMKIVFQALPTSMEKTWASFKH